MAAGTDAVVIEHETLTRLANLIVTVVPLALLGFAGGSPGVVRCTGRISSCSRSPTRSRLPA